MMYHHISRADRLCKRALSRSGRTGFTLIEMSVVIVILAIVIAATAYVGKNTVEDARRIQTRTKLDTLEEALLSFRAKHGRLPCPAPQSVLEGNAEYGFEDNDPGVCAAATYQNSAGTVVEGAVPFRTLGLTEEFMIDGWGHRFIYAPQLRFTEPQAFNTYDIRQHCTGSEVRDESGGVRTTRAAYVLASMGMDGHGAFQPDGTRLNAGSTNSDQQLNCNCNSSGVFDGTYGAVYVQKPFAPDGANTFDDEVRYKERWQMRVSTMLGLTGSRDATGDDPQGTGYVGPDIMLSMSGDGNVYFISKTGCDTYAEFTSVTGAVGSAASGAAISPNNNYWAVTSASAPYLTIYKRNQTTGALTTTGVTISAAPSGPGRGIAFSRTGRYLAVGQWDGVSTGGINIYVVNNTTDTFTLVGTSPTIASSQDVLELAYSPSEDYLAATSTASPFVKVFKRSDLTYTAVDLAVKMDDAPDGTSMDVAFSPDGRYLAVGHLVTPFLSTYSIDSSTDSFTKTANPATLPANNPGVFVGGVSFSPDSLYLAATVDNSTTADTAFIYRIDNTATPPLTIVESAGMTFDQAYPVKFSLVEPTIVLGADGASNSNFASLIRYIPERDLFTRQPSNTLPQPAAAVTGVAVRHK